MLILAASATEPDHSAPGAITCEGAPSSEGVSTRRTTGWSCVSVSVSSIEGVATRMPALFFSVKFKR